MVDFAEFKRFFFYNLIGSLIISALVAVVTVLIGEFNELTGRVLFTLFMVIVHSVFSLIFIWDDERQHTFEKLSFFINILFVLVIVSFLTSLFGIWTIFPAGLVVNLYQTYFVIAFASLHADILSKALNKERYMDIIVYVNYIFMAIVVLMLLPVIFIDNSIRVLGEVFFRLLGAVGIIDGTLSILTIIFYKLYMHNHPKIENPLQAYAPGQVVQKRKKGLSFWVWILIIYLVLQIGLPLMLLTFLSLSRFF